MVYRGDPYYLCTLPTWYMHLVYTFYLVHLPVVS